MEKHVFVMVLKKQQLLPWSINRLIVSFVLALAWSIPLNAQKLTGVVNDESGDSLSGAIVRAISRDGKLLSFASSGPDGGFALPLPASADTVKIALMGYSEAIILPPFQQHHIIRLSIRPETLRESVVSAAKVMVAGDTLRYNANALRKPEDQILADMLVRIPGIEIDKTGFVKYNGLAINKFYVDGKDILGNSYNLATKNLPVEAITNIEILEKHQPVRLLQGVKTSEHSAMNIVLKESARGKVNGALLAGGGIEADKPRFNASIKGTAFYIGSAWSSVNSGGYDNQGNALRQSDYSFSQERSALHQPLREYVKAYLSRAPLEEKRTLFNRTLEISTVDRYSPKQEITTGVTVKMGRDRQDSWLETNTVYLMPDSELSVTRTEELKSLTSNASVLLSYSRNTDKLLFSNSLYADFELKEGSNVVSGDFLRQQISSNRQWNIGNEAVASVKWNNKVIGVQSLTQLSSGKESLFVQEGNISESLKGILFNQRFSLIGIGSTRGNSRISIVPKTQWISYRVSNDLSGLPRNLTEGLLKEETATHAIHAGAEGTFTCRGNKYETNLSAVVDFARYSLGKQTANLFLGGLSTKARYETGRWDCTISSSFMWKGPDIQSLGSTLVLLDYYTLWKGSQVLRRVPEWTIGSTLKYREPVSGWNGHLSVNYFKSQTHLSEREIYDDYILYYQGDNLVQYNRFSITNEVSKGIFSINGILKFGFNYSRTGSEIRQNHQTVTYLTHLVSPHAEISLSLNRWWSTVVNLSATRSITRSPGVLPLGNLQLYGCMKHSFRLCKSVSLGLYFDFYHFSEIDKTILLPDFFFRWKHRNGIQIRMEANNLMNNRNYSYQATSPLMTETFRYRIRPLELLLGVEWYF